MYIVVSGSLRVYRKYGARTRREKCFQRSVERRHHAQNGETGDVSLSVVAFSTYLH